MEISWVDVDFFFSSQFCILFYHKNENRKKNRAWLLHGPQASRSTCDGIRKTFTRQTRSLFGANINRITTGTRHAQFLLQCRTISLFLFFFLVAVVALFVCGIN